MIAPASPFPSAALAPVVSYSDIDNVRAYVKSRLLAQHLFDLRKSGLADETIAAAGLYSESSPEAIQRILGWRYPAKDLGPCLVFPFGNGFARVKPDCPRQDENQKPVKYEQPRGVALRPYVPPLARWAISQVGHFLLMTEGEKKALAACQDGFPCIGLTGVFSWQQKREKPTNERQLIPDLESIDWQGRLVAICFDHDEQRRPGVNQGASELARVLQQRGACPFLVDLPPSGKAGQHA